MLKPDEKILRELISDDAITPLNKDADGKFFVELVEAVKDKEKDSNKEEKICTVKISDLPPDSIVIKTDRFPQPGPIFNGNRGECRRSDYAIISPEKKIVLYIELKEGKGDRSHIINQFRGAQCFLFYCEKIVEVFWNEHDFLKDYESRFIALLHLKKKQIGMSRGRNIKIEPQTEVPDKPDELMRISYAEEIGFGKIAWIKNNKI